MSVSRHPLPRTARRPLQADERIEWHDHTSAQLVYPGRGALQVFTIAGSWIVPPLRGVWLPAGVAHSHRAHGPTELLSLAFPASADPFGEREPVVVAISALLREVILTLTGDGSLGRSSRTLLSRVAFDQLRRAPNVGHRLPQPHDDRLVRIADMLTADPTDGRSLSQFGAVVGAGARTLSRLFRQETGMSFPQWRAQLRLHHAQLLLAEGTSVTATAVACGYRSTSAFIESFRAAYGSTPGARR